MKLTEQYIKFEYLGGGIDTIEKAARTCYKSEGKIEEGSANEIIERLIKNKHHAMLEFAWMQYRIITDRGVTHELVRHRLFSFAQESTRYCNYSGGIEFIVPLWFGEDDIADSCWYELMEHAETSYKELLHLGWPPQKARVVLPNSLKTEIVVAGNIREWRHFFELRTTLKAHPQMRDIAKRILADALLRIPVVFDDLLDILD